MHAAALPDRDEAGQEAAAPAIHFVAVLTWRSPASRVVRLFLICETRLARVRDRVVEHGSQARSDSCDLRENAASGVQELGKDPANTRPEARIRG